MSRAWADDSNDVSHLSISQLLVLKKFPVVVVLVWYRVIIVSALSLSLRDKESFRDWEIKRAWQYLLNPKMFVEHWLDIYFLKELIFLQIFFLQVVNDSLKVKGWMDFLKVIVTKALIQNNAETSFIKCIGSIELSCKD